MRRETPSYSSGTLSIDPIQPEDLPVFREMLDELVDVLEMKDVYTIGDDALYHALFDDPPGSEAIIARHKGEPAGIATWTDSFHLVRGKYTMLFDYIYVRPQFRNFMITPAMLIYLLMLARRRGYFRMEGFVHEWNIETTNFYRALSAEENTQQSFHIDLDKVDWAPFESVIGSHAPPQE